jgi:hypothetical protein
MVPEASTGQYTLAHRKRYQATGKTLEVFAAGQHIVTMRVGSRAIGRVVVDFEPDRLLWEAPNRARAWNMR